MFTCVIRYEVDPNKLNEFREYAEAWIELIEKYGGKHHGYFLPPTEAERKSLPDPTFSFPGLGVKGPSNMGFALFSFESVEKYEAYKRDVADDEGCKIATARFDETKCFTRYERSFTIPVLCMT